MDTPTPSLTVPFDAYTPYARPACSAETCQVVAQSCTVDMEHENEAGRMPYKTENIEKGNHTKTH